MLLGLASGLLGFAMFLVFDRIMVTLWMERNMRHVTPNLFADFILLQRFM